MNRMMIITLSLVLCVACSSVVAVHPDVTNDEGSVSDEGTPPADEGTPPADEGTSPGDEGTPPVDEGTPPGDEGTPPGDEGTSPADEGTPPVDEGSAPVECSNVCGDLDTDEVVTDDDLTFLEIAALGEAGTLPDWLQECAATNGDVLQDGVLTQADVYIIAAMVEGLVTTACESCELSPALDRPCGDANGDGILNVQDMTIVVSILSGPGLLESGGVDGCTYWAIDVDGNGTFELPDHELLIQMVLSGSGGSCAAVAGEGGGDPGGAPTP